MSDLIERLRRVIIVDGLEMPGPDALHGEAADEIERLTDKLLHSDRKEIEACYRKMDSLEADNEKLRAALQSIVGQTDDQFVDGVWREVNTTAKEALAVEDKT